jgi:hypothetical protein
MMVKTRLWLAGEVSTQRDVTLTRRLIERVRACALRRPLLCCTDGLCSNIRAIRESFRDPVPTGTQGRPRRRPWRNVCLSQVVKRYVQRHVVGVERRIVDGTRTRVETLRRRSQGDGVINTAYIERLKETFRGRLALRRQPLTLQHGMYLIGSTVYNFCTYHESLRQVAPVTGTVWRARTPAMAVGITDHCWPVRELLSFHVSPPRWSSPKRRGRPSRAPKRLVEQWCS